MRRRDFLRQSSAATATAAAAVSAKAATTASRSVQGDRPSPNVLIIHCDELNFRTLGCYRRTLPAEQAFMWGPKAVVETPHIDSLAEEGTLCTGFYAATPVCSPSRSSFISGMYPQHTGVTTNNLPLKDHVVSFAELLKRRGYATGYAGKWHLDGTGKPQWQPKRNFGFVDNRFMFNRGHWKQLELTEDGPRVKARDAKGRPTYSVAGADENSFTTDWLTTRALEFVRDHHDKPFCYMLSIPDPHGPDTVRPPYDSMFSDQQVQKPRTYDKPDTGVPSWAMPQPKCHYKMASYHGMIKCIDDNVGRVIAELRRLGLYENTILVFTADHGDMRGEHHRQNKGIPLEASAKVPFLIRWPENIPAGARVGSVMNTADFLPSLMAMMDVQTDHAVQGRNMAPLLTGTTQTPEGPDVTFMRSTGTPGGKFGWIAAVTPRYKLVLAPKDDPWLLDLEADPDELHNFIDSVQHKTIVRELAQQLKEYGVRFDDPYTAHAAISGQLEQLLA